MRRVQKSGTDGTRAIVRDKSKDSIAIFGNIEEGLSAGESQTGRFTTKRTTLRHSLAGSSPGARPRQSLVGLPRPSVVERRSSTMHRRFSITEVEDDVEMSREGNTPGGMSSQDDNSFWDATDTHHVLPVFASARTYVPSSFESLLVQSFFGVLTPLICEKLVCGQAGQSVVQISMPTSLVGRIFVDMFRIFSYHHVSAITISLFSCFIMIFRLFVSGCIERRRSVLGLPYHTYILHHRFVCFALGLNR